MRSRPSSSPTGDGANGRPSCTPTRPTTSRAAGGRCASATSGSASPAKGSTPAQRLGRHRWVVERTLAWLNRYRRLTVRYERRADIHQAFLTLGCALICFNALQKGF